MKNYSIKILGILVLCMATILSSTLIANAQLPPQNSNIVTNAQMLNARTYATMFNVSEEEALRRLNLQNVIGNLNTDLLDNMPDNFSGLWLEHTPEFKVVIRAKTHLDISPLLVGRSIGELIEYRESRASFRDFEDAREQAAETLDALNIKAHSAINFYEDRVEIYVMNKLQVEDLLQKGQRQLPDLVTIVQVESLAIPVATAYGGLDVDHSGGAACTSGFSVDNYSGVEGITTAGHCPDTNLTFNGAGGNGPLTYQTGTPGGVYDIQWMTAPGSIITNIINDGNGTRAITGKRVRNTQSVGSFVCKYGRTTGYSCGTIVTNTFDGVNVEMTNSVAGGDSGGPWFWGNDAYGTTISSFGSHSIYGPVDHIYNVLGLRILMN